MSLRVSNLFVGRASALLFVFIAARVGWASETDQYTVAPQALVDSGGELERLVQRRLERVVARVNGEFDGLIERAGAADSAAGRDGYLARAAERLTSDYLARAVFDELGRDDARGLLGELYAYRPSGGGVTRFVPELDRSIYGGTPFNMGLRVVPMLPTFRWHGVYAGGDKLGHFFQQGYEYYQEYGGARERGESESAALGRAVHKGVDQEKTIYGEWVDGIYSNADLAANYAGLHFYLNLTRPVVVGNVRRPALLVLRNQRWVFNSAAAAGQPMRALITEHWDESLNPCRYGWTLRDTVRSNVMARGRAWAAARRLTRQQAGELWSLHTWFGADYGHTGRGVLFPMPDEWFDR